MSAAGDKGERTIATGMTFGRSVAESWERSDEHWKGMMEGLGLIATVLHRYGGQLTDKRLALGMELSERTFGLVDGQALIDGLAPELALKERTILLDAALAVGMAQGIMKARGLEEVQIALPSFREQPPDDAA